MDNDKNKDKEIDLSDIVNNKVIGMPMSEGQTTTSFSKPLILNTSKIEPEKKSIIDIVDKILEPNKDKEENK